MIETIAHLDARACWEEWRSLDIPVLVAFGSAGMFPSSAQLELVRQGRQIRRVTLAGGSHDAHLDAFTPWIHELSAFLATAPPPTSTTRQPDG
jgi:pimeloyl-ACP methyl ester carboxylesterase